MIKTFEELLEKLKADEKCTSVPEKTLKDSQSGEERIAMMAIEWMSGYLFCLVDQNYISHEEWEELHSILFN